MHFDTLFPKFFTRRAPATHEDSGIHQSPSKTDRRIKSGDDAV